MGNKIKITEEQLKRLIENNNKKVIEEQEADYMFFSNLEQLHRQTGKLLELDKNQIEQLLQNGHDWADDHVTVAKENLSQVFDFLMNETKGSGDEHGEQGMDQHMDFKPEEKDLSFSMNESKEKIKSQFQRFM